MHDEIYESARLRRDELKAELARIEAFIATYDSLRPKQQPQRTAEPSSATPETIAAIIAKAGRPMKRGEIAAALATQGISVKQNYLGTLLWRWRDRFENVPGKGYSIR